MASESTEHPTPLHDLTSFKRDLLVVLQSMPEASGLQLKAVLDEAYSNEINHGRLYPNLDDLVSMGFVRKGEADRRTNTYELTRRGERELANHFAWQRQFITDDD